MSTEFDKKLINLINEAIKEDSDGSFLDENTPSLTEEKIFHTKMVIQNNIRKNRQNRINLILDKFQKRYSTGSNNLATTKTKQQKLSEIALIINKESFYVSFFTALDSLDANKSDKAINSLWKSFNDIGLLNHPQNT